MVGNLNKNDIAFVRRQMATLEAFAKRLKKDKEKEEAIDEKYRLMAEKAKKDLVVSIADWEKKIEFVSSSTVALYGDTVQNLMEKINTEMEPPLIIHNKETGEEEINPEAVAPAVEKIEEEKPVAEATQEPEAVVEETPEDDVPEGIGERISIYADDKPTFDDTPWNPLPDSAEIPAAEAAPEFDGAGFTEEDNFPTEELPEPGTEVDDPADNDDEFPDLPEFVDEWIK